MSGITFVWGALAGMWAASYALSHVNWRRDNAARVADRLRTAGGKPVMPPNRKVRG